MLFEHLGDTSNSLIYKNLTQLSLFSRYLDDQFNDSIDKKAWSTDSPSIDVSFKDKTFYLSNLKGFLLAYKDWLKELEANSRSFSPFHLDSDISALISGRAAKTGIFGFGKFSYDKFDQELSKSVKTQTYSSPEQKLIHLFFQATGKIVSNHF